MNQFQWEDPDFGPHILYRFCDRDGVLLYVGITNNPGKRFGRHRSSQAWWDEVTTIHLMQYPSREDLVAAEAHAIGLERPVYNIQGSPLESRGKAFDITVCPACRIESFFRHDLGRYFHTDGSENIDCWVLCAQGNVEYIPWDRYGRLEKFMQ